MMDLDILYKNIGQKFNKKLLGCAMPVVMLYPETSGHEYIDNIFYILAGIKLYFREVSRNDLMVGDIVVFRYPKFNHLGVYAGNDRIFHCMKGSALELGRLSNKKSAKYFFRKK